MDNSDNEAIAETATAIRKRRDTIKFNNHMKKDKAQNRTALPRTSSAVHRSVDGMIQSIKKAGYDTTTLEARVNNVKANKAAAGQKRKAQEMDVDSGEEWQDETQEDAMDVDGEDDVPSPKKRAKGNSGVTSKGQRNYQRSGLRDEAQAKKAVQLIRLAQRTPNRLARAGEADRASMLLSDFLRN